jgi:catechol 2,3-dioxygenase-like lactoylglutathione lyase family enzyme
MGARQSAAHWRSEDMAKLRHIAMAVDNPDATATFYEHAFGMQRVRQSTSAVLLSDGVISLAILDSRNSHEALGHRGLHHFGVIAADVDETAARAEAAGARYADSEENVSKRFANRAQLENGQVIAAAREQQQRKYVDPNGIKFDIVNALHARNSWKLPL